MAVANVKQSADDARLAALTLPEGQGWVQSLRNGALTRLRSMGLPQRRDEYWRFTRPDTLTQADAPEAALFKSDEPEIFGQVDRIRIVFVDGVFDADASDDLAAEGLTIERLADAAHKDIHWAKDLYGVLEERGQGAVPRPLAALNTALAPDGVLIHVTGQASKPINLIYRHESTRSDAYLHHVIKLDAGADMTLLENGPAAARFNNVLEVDVADGAAFHHVRIQGRDHERRSATHIFARLAAKSSFKSFTMTANGVMTRNECVVDLIGDDAVTHVAGVSVGDGDFHDDDTLFITHDALRCESRQVFKKVLRNGATGVFQGKILVKPDAQKTDGYQLSQALMLDDDSQFLVKPELEIHADDVMCSHGSTSGAIDEDALYYLRARGVPRPIATNLLTLAFLAEAVDEIEDEGLQDEVKTLLQGWLERRLA